MAEFVILGTNNFFTRILIIAGIFFFAVLLDGTISKHPKPMSRFMFGLIFLCSTMALTVLPSVFLSAATEDVDRAAFVWLVGTACSMVILAYGARRRSVDAYGDASKAYMAVVPIICLVLIFKKPADRERLDQRTKTAIAGRVIAFTACAVTLTLAGSFVKVVFDNMNQNAVVNVTSLPIARAVRIQAALLNANAPQVIDAETTLIKAAASGNTLSLAYHITGNAAEFSTDAFEASMMPVLKRNVCSDTIFGDLLHRGATVVFEYSGVSRNQDLQNHRLEIAATDCQ